MDRVIELLVKPAVLIAIFFGGSVFLLRYILKLFKNQENAEENQQNDTANSAAGGHHSDKKRDKDVGAAKSKKKFLDNRHRADKQKFSSPWLLTTLKGHQGPVLNIDYSSNGKYLASCGEEDPDPDPDADMSTDGSVYNSDNKENRPPVSAPKPKSTKGLSRRQRKNRRRDDSPEKKKLKIPVKEEKPKLKGCPAFLKVNFSERDFSDYLLSYVLTHFDLIKFGYPYRSPAHGHKVFFRNGMSQTFDVNAHEFIPGAWSLPTCDGSSDSDSNEKVFYRKESIGNKSFDVNAQEFVPGMMYSSNSDGSSESEPETPECQYGIQRVCTRCRTGFFTTTTEYLTQERCVHHWGKLRPEHKASRTYRYLCCQGFAGSPGCTTAPLHVWNGVETPNGLNGPYSEYVHTYQRKVFSPDGSVGVFAMDCEMSYTIAGLEATKVTVVTMEGRVVYDTLVRPKNEIIDYNTRFSGIKAEDFESANVRTLKQVQNDLRKLIFADTILIGHGLENDLRALKMIHPTIVDTSIAFPHYRGAPYKLSLKSLTSTYLKREIQESESGHSSREDATACMELMLYKVRKDFPEL